jgi:hypothetical protein
MIATFGGSRLGEDPKAKRPDVGIREVGSMAVRDSTP